MKILVDMNLSPRWVDFLGDRDFQGVHWSSIGPGDATDIRIFEYALDNDYVVLTNDLDFGAILSSTGKRKPSVVQIRGHDLLPARIGPTVVKAIWQLKDDLAAGALVTIDPKRIRISALPLGRAM